VERVEARHPGKASAAHLDFLRRHDGRSDCPWGIRLFGVAELCGAAYAAAEEVLSYHEYRRN
jgi:hypothetical protein